MEINAGTQSANEQMKSKTLSGTAIALIVLIVLVVVGLIIFLAVWFTRPCRKVQYNKLYINREPEKITETIVINDSAPYKRSIPQQLTKDQVGHTMSLAELSNKNSKGDKQPVVLADITAEDAKSWLSGESKKPSFTVILHSAGCPACRNLVKDVKQWAQDGKLNGKHIGLLPASEYSKLKDHATYGKALETRGIPYSVNFKDGVASGNKTGSMPEDAFMTFVTST